MKFFKKFIAYITATTMVFSALAVNAYAAETSIYDLQLDESMSFGTAGTTLDKGNYTVPVSLMNASNIENLSMAASCIVGGSLDIAEDGTAKVTVDLTSVTFAGLTLYAQDWKIYQGNSASGDTIDADYLEDENGHVVQISFILPDNGMDGVYLNMTVPNLMSQDAFLKIDFANSVKNTKALTFGSAATELEVGVYSLPVKMMNASNISSPSMAGSCVTGGSVVVSEDGSAKVSVSLQAVSVFGLTAWASDWKIYKENAAKGEKIDALAHMNMDGNVDMITFDILDNTLDGVYISMFVSAMNYSPDAYLAFDFANAVKATEFGSAKTSLLPGTYSLPLTMKNAANINNNSMAAGCINGNAELMVCNDGTAMVTVNLQPASAFGLTLSASDWKIYQGSSTSSELLQAARHNSAGEVNQIKFTLPDNSFDGTYVNMYIGSPMNMTQNAYFLMDFTSCERISNNTADTSTPVYADGKAEITVNVPKHDDGKWIHKVGITVDDNDSELINYKDGDNTYDFVADITADSYGNDTVNYESYYIYNYSDGDFSTEINADNYKSADEDDGSGSNPLQLFKKILNNSIIIFKEVE